jgi:MFS family permease
MLKIATVLFVFLGGFAVMVLEIIGTLFLAKDFGGSFNVWTCQIGVILIALSLGYAIGGTLADRFHRASFLAIPMAIAGAFIFFIPKISQPMLDAIVHRHPKGLDIPIIWQNLDPALGSAVVFFLPCFALALISPYMVRLTARNVESVGTISGLIYAASTFGSIAGVFIPAYIFMDFMSIIDIFHATGIVVFLLAGLSLAMDKMLESPQPVKVEQQSGAGSP